MNVFSWKYVLCLFRFHSLHQSFLLKWCAKVPNDFQKVVLLFYPLRSLAVKYRKGRNAMVLWKNVAERLQMIVPLSDHCNVRFVFVPQVFFSAFIGTNRSSCHLKLVNFEAHENHIAHETQGLSHRLLVVRRGKPFKVTLLFGGHAWNPHAEVLSLQVCLGTNKQAVCLWSNLLLTRAMRQWSGSIQALHHFLTFTIIKYSLIGRNFDSRGHCFISR